MNLKLKHFFIIFLILLFTIQVQADAPINYNKELASDVELRGTFFTNGNADGFYVSLIGENSIQIVSDIHHINKTIKIKKTALDSRFKKFNGINIGITHISDDGIVNNYISPVVVDGEFVYITVDFSTIIINGMTGTTTTTLTGLSVNQSISVPDGSSYDLNITNNEPSAWTINGTDYPKRVLWTLNTTAENLTDFQVGRITPYDSDMQVDMDDRQLTYYENDTLISFWDEEVINSTNATGHVKVPKTSTTEQQQYWLYYGNPNVSSASSISNTFIVGADFEETGAPSGWSTYSGTPNYDSTTHVYSGTESYTCSVDGFSYFPSFTRSGIIIEETMVYSTSIGTTQYLIYNYDNERIGISASKIYLVTSSGNYAGTVTLSSNTWYKFLFKIDYDNNLASGYVYNTAGTLLDSLVDKTHTDTGQYPLFQGKTILWQDDFRVRKGTATEPTWLADGTEQTATGTLNITASITGDNNTQSYNTSQSREFTLTPTGETNNVLINTTSTDYDVTVTTYWTENTTLQTETATAGYTKQYINYTPSFNVTSADLNTTFTFNFSAQDYVGAATSTLDDVSKTTTRDGQDINASVGSLTEATPYWWNVTVPYNNVPTVGTITNQTAYLGIAESFTAPSYSDPEGLAIDTHYWQFGDGDTSANQNPTHTYTSIDTFSANYTVTETATVSPQAVLREFTVDVEVQPPQNVTTVPHQTNVSIDWDDYVAADKYSVYELEDGFPYVDTNPTVDGVKDAIYDYAHEFLIFSPNPVNPGDYETSYPVRTALGAYFFHEAVDNDDKLGDDDLIYYFDLDNDGLTVDDPAWKITNNIVKKYLWNGGSWQVTGVSDAVGASTGGSTHYPKHELFIPIAELGANWTNGSTVKVLVKREDSSLTPDVVTWYPYGNINNTDTALWQEMALNEPDSYTWLANITLSNYTATNLTPFTIYHGAVSSWNGTDESDYTLFDVITKDIPVYSVSGYVFDDLGNTIAGAVVHSCNAFVHEITQTDIYGYWIGYNFREGNYTICANKSGYADNYTNIYVSTNLTNINVTLTAFEMTDWMLWEKLLEIEDLVTPNSTVPETTPPENAMPLPLFITWIVIMFVMLGISVPKHDDYDNLNIGIPHILFGLIATTIAYVLSKQIINGQVVQTFSGISQINTVVITTQSVQISWLSYVLQFIGIAAFILTMILILAFINEHFMKEIEDEEVV